MNLLLEVAREFGRGLTVELQPLAAQPASERDLPRRDRWELDRGALRSACPRAKDRGVD